MRCYSYRGADKDRVQTELTEGIVDELTRKFILLIFSILDLKTKMGLF